MFYLVWLLRFISFEKSRSVSKQKRMRAKRFGHKNGLQKKIGGRPFPSTQTLEVDWLKVGIKTKMYLLNVRWLEMERIELFPQK